MENMNVTLPWIYSRHWTIPGRKELKIEICNTLASKAIQTPTKQHKMYSASKPKPTGQT
jgi:hypothetical protein